MFHRSWVSKVGTLLVIAGLVLTSSTNVLAQSEGVEAAPASAAVVAPLSNQLFFPLVQSGLAAEVHAADSSGPIPSGQSPINIDFNFKGYAWSGTTLLHYGSSPPSVDPIRVDANGALHLKAYYECITVSTVKVFNFGQFKWQVSSKLDTGNQSLELRLGSGPQIWFTSYSMYSISNSNPVGEYSVSSQTYAFPMPNLDQPSSSTHYLTWRPSSIRFQSLSNSLRVVSEIATWTAGLRIPQQPLPVHMKFCSDANVETEVVIQQFTFDPIVTE